jgi:hypothetical protein
MTAITSAIPEVVTLVTGVFDMIVGNPLLVTFVAISLVGAAIGLFSTLRGAAQ